MAFLAAPLIAGAASAVVNNVMKSGQSNNQPQAAPLMSPVTHQQLDNSFGQQQDALGRQASFVNALQAQNGLQNQSGVFDQQQQLANQLSLQAQGQGPNPAQAMLANSTSANVANQAALMAGQRGAGANAGLIARQAAMQGGALQQQQAGQGAALQAQQQLAAQQMLMQQQAQLGNTAGQQVGNLGQAIMGQNQAAQNNQNSLLGAATGQNQAQLSNTQGMNAINQGNAQFNAGFGQKVIGGIANAAGPAIGQLFGGGAKAPGGTSPDYVRPTDSDMFGGGDSQPVQAMAAGGSIHGPQSLHGKHMAAICMRKGGSVPGKAPVKGNSYQNDNVHAVLSPGEVVIPRSVMQGKNAPAEAAKFVQAILARKGAPK